MPRRHHQKIDQSSLSRKMTSKAVEEPSKSMDVWRKLDSGPEIDSPPNLSPFCRFRPHGSMRTRKWAHRKKRRRTYVEPYCRDTHKRRNFQRRAFGQDARSKDECPDNVHETIHMNASSPLNLDKKDSFSTIPLDVTFFCCPGALPN